MVKTNTNIARMSLIQRNLQILLTIAVVLFLPEIAFAQTQNNETIESRDDLTNVPDITTSPSSPTPSASSSTIAATTTTSSTVSTTSSSSTTTTKTTTSLSSTTTTTTTTTSSTTTKTATPTGTTESTTVSTISSTISSTASTLSTSSSTLPSNSVSIAYTLTATSTKMSATTTLTSHSITVGHDTIASSITSTTSAPTSSKTLSSVSQLSSNKSEISPTISETKPSESSTSSSASTSPLTSSTSLPSSSLTTSSPTSNPITTSYTSGVTTASYTQPATGAGKSDAWKIAVGVCVPVGVIMIVSAILLFLLCRNKNNKKEKTLTESWDLSTRNNSLTSSKPIKVSAFVESVADMEKDSGLLFAAEFDDLKNVGRHQPSSQAILPVNKDKNRFVNIKPYDITIVKLNSGGDANSEYINASWMPGYRSPKEYISTQGPMISTMNDFWRMVWEYECKGVVMLANLIEGGMSKCDQYWPKDDTPTNYGNLTVTITKETKARDWDVKDMEIAMGSKVHNLKHFHYRAWDDMVVPTEPTSILYFIQEVRDGIDSFRNSTTTDSSLKPLVVHCSAGVGRSGTFIALDTLLSHLNSSSTLDVYGVVYKLRMNRMNMVQTELQYAFIHRCISHVIQTLRNSRVGVDNNGFVPDEEEAETTNSSVISFAGPPHRSNRPIYTIYARDNYGSAPPVTNPSLSKADRRTPASRSMPITGREVPSSIQNGDLSHTNPSFYEANQDIKPVGLINLAPPSPMSLTPRPAPRRSLNTSPENGIASVNMNPASPYNSNVIVDTL